MVTVFSTNCKKNHQLAVLRIACPKAIILVNIVLLFWRSPVPCYGEAAIVKIARRAFAWTLNCGVAAVSDQPELSIDFLTPRVGSRAWCSCATGQFKLVTVG